MLSADSLARWRPQLAPLAFDAQVRGATLLAAGVPPQCTRPPAASRHPLFGSWADLLPSFSALPAGAVQTRHTFARLVAAGPLPAFTLDAAARHATDPDGHLALHFDAWSAAYAAFERCTCCDSAGRLELLGRHGTEFLQLAARPGLPIDSWLAVLAPWIDASGLRVAPSPSVAATSAAAAPWLPRLPDSAQLISRDAELLHVLLTALADEATPLRVTLRTAAATHRRTLTLRRVVTDSVGLLTALGSGGITLQLALHATAGLACQAAADGLRLHAVSATGAVLLTFSAAPGATAWTAWHQALHAAFPFSDSP